jgi:hypothetical protein
MAAACVQQQSPCSFVRSCCLQPFVTHQAQQAGIRLRQRRFGPWRALKCQAQPGILCHNKLLHRQCGYGQFQPLDAPNRDPPLVIALGQCGYRHLGAGQDLFLHVNANDQQWCAANGCPPASFKQKHVRAASPPVSLRGLHRRYQRIGQCPQHRSKLQGHDAAQMLVFSMLKFLNYLSSACTAALGVS